MSDEPKKRGRPKKTPEQNTGKLPRAREDAVNDGRDRLFLREYFANGGNATEAELAVYPKKLRSSAASDASQRLTRIRRTMKWQEYLAEAGLDDVGLMAKARQLRDARMILLDAGGEEHDVPDNRTQLGVMQTIGKWSGKEKLDLNIDAQVEIKHTFDPEGI
jgi:hypothetical protein